MNFLLMLMQNEKEKFPEEAEEKAEAPADASAKPYQISQLPHARPVSPILTWRGKA